MNEAEQDEVWATLDREYLASAAQQGPTPVSATIRGAHLYGFASPNSDVDLRGAFMLPAPDLLGLDSKFWLDGSQRKWISAGRGNWYSARRARRVGLALGTGRDQWDDEPER